MNWRAAGSQTLSSLMVARSTKYPSYSKYPTATLTPIASVAGSEVRLQYVATLLCPRVNS